MQALVLTNRGDRYVHDAVASLNRYVTGWDHLTIVDDSGDRDHRARLEARYGEVIAVAPRPAGYTPAMGVAFNAMRGEHVLFWEEDFRALRPVHLPDLTRHLDSDEHLAQVALLRGPWFTNEHEHGGVIEARQAEGATFTRQGGLIRHTDHFTGNPSVLPRSVFTRPWPQVTWSEAAFGRALVKAGYEFAYADLGVTVDHIGERTGHGY